MSWSKLEAGSPELARLGAQLLFELEVESALLGARASADDWPPVYSTWSAGKSEGVG